VVRNYLLPMFEKDSKKHLYAKQKTKEGLGGGSPRIMGLDNTVYGELKLSERLSLEML
jgi:hypothetical protein